jgi:hypothetical protein
LTFETSNLTSIWHFKHRFHWLRSTKHWFVPFSDPRHEIIIYVDILIPKLDNDTTIGPGLTPKVQLIQTYTTLPRRWLRRRWNHWRFWLVIPLYASVNDVLSLYMIMAVIALLVDRSQSFASLHFILSMSSTRASNSQKPSLPMCPLKIPMHGICKPFQVNFHVLPFKKTFKILLILWHCFQLMGT